MRKVVFKSSAHYYGAEQDDPAFFTEEMRRPHPPRTALERDIVEAEARCATSRCATRHHGHGAALRQRARPAAAHLAQRSSGCRRCPTILGFDPRYQFIHEDDLAGLLEHAVRHDLDGVYNGAADGVLALSEVAGLLGKQLAPVLPPVGHGAGGRRPAPRRACASRPRCSGCCASAAASTTASSRPPATATATPRARPSLKLREHQRLAASSATARRPTATSATSRSSCAAARACGPTARRPAPAPSNLAPGERRGARPAPGRRAGYDDLDAEELIALLPSLEPEALADARRRTSARTPRGREVMKAIASLQGWEART